MNIQIDDLPGHSERHLEQLKKDVDRGWLRFCARRKINPNTGEFGKRTFLFGKGAETGTGKPPKVKRSKGTKPSKK